MPAGERSGAIEMAFDDKKSNKKKPRIAFAGEEYGFGYLATNAFVDAVAKRDNRVEDGGYAGAPKTANLKEFQSRAAFRDRFEFKNDQINRQPLRTKEQALLAVKSGTADFAVVPFYSPYAGYDFETLRAISNLFTIMGVEQYEATDQMCLAVYEPQVLDLVQSSHPGSALSSLMKHRRNSWGSNESVNTRHDGRDHDNPGDTYRADLNIDQAGQMLLRDRIDMVFAGPEAARRCKAKLDGLRGAGVEVSETLRSVEPHREMARLARKTLDRDRQVNTFFDPREGTANYVSTMSGGRQDSQLYAVVLPFQVAMMSADFTIIDTEMEDADPVKTRFMVVRQAPDESLYEDAYRTTDAKTRYWMKRLRDVNHSANKQFKGGKGGGNPGVRVMLRFQRSGSAASIGDVENYLRNYGVRHSNVRIDEDSEQDAPAGIVLDIEFEDDDFYYNPLRRVRGTVVNGAIKKAFQRWKNRGVTVLGAMPYASPQLPKHQKRRWWLEAVSAWAADFSETMFIRLSRLLFMALPLALIAYAIWYFLTRG